MRPTTRALPALAIALAAALGCSRNDDPPPAHADAAPAAAAPTNRVEIPATVRGNLGITFAEVERRRVDSTIRVPGAFEYQPTARREYRLTLDGHVDLAVDQYQPVEAGDLLYRFRSPQWRELAHEIIEGEQAVQAAMASLRVAGARVGEARARLSNLRERLESLAGASVRDARLEAEIAEIEASVPRLQAERAHAVTTLTNAEQTRTHALHVAARASGIRQSELVELVDHNGATHPKYHVIEWIEVRATEAGVVETLALTNGAFADAPSLVLSVVDPTRVRFRAMALQADIARLGATPAGRIVPPAAPGLPPSDAVDASVAIGLEAHPEQRTVTLLATPAEARPWIRPGVSAFLEVVIDSTGAPALAIPRASVVQDGIVHVFFRRDPRDPNKAIRVEADMGVHDGRWVAINSGLMLGDEVVLDGAYELKLATQQSGVMQKGGHFHADGTWHADDH